MISKWLVPPGGWRYQDKEFWIEAQTYDDLVLAVFNHRNSNEKDLADVEKDVQTQIADLNPSVSLNMPPVPSLIDKVKSFAASFISFLGSGGQLVDQKTANDRGAICVSCHNNKPGESTVSGGCCGGKGAQFVENTALQTIRMTVIQNRTTPNDDKLKMCNICGCDLKIKIWFPKNALGVTDENKNAWPTFCWVKNL